MFDLFRLMVLRPPEGVDSSATIPVNHQSAFLTSLRDASMSESPLATMQQVAEHFAHSELFVKNISSLVHFQQYQAVSDAISLPEEPTIDDLVTLIKKVFQANIRDIVRDEGFLNDKKRIQDSIVSLQLAAPPQDVQPGQLLQICRVIDL